ncbi:MAG: hypothetical protein OQK24_01155 [Magnetovibrio sp.]|nr:hypothetical protein [Magnetovibrio sp.]
MELSFTVWQFVRLMVHIEDSPQPSAEEAALFSEWQDIWVDLDQRLVSLAEEDFDAYSALMMDQEVILSNIGERHIPVAKNVLQKVMAQLDTSIEAHADDDSGQDGDDEHLLSLKFERRELRQLIRKIGRMTDAS